MAVIGWEREGVKKGPLIDADARVVVVGVEIREVTIQGQRECGRLPCEALGKHGSMVVFPGKLQEGGVGKGAEFPSF